MEKLLFRMGVFLMLNKMSKLNGCLRFVLQNKLIDKVVIGLGQKSHLSSFVKELKKIETKKRNMILVE